MLHLPSLKIYLLNIGVEAEYILKPRRLLLLNEVPAALRTFARRVADDLGVHRAGVFLCARTARRRGICVLAPAE